MEAEVSLLIQGTCFEIPLASKSVHCVVTSPPYWGLRKYAGEQGDEPLGLEATPERHVERTVEWAREIRRVLRDDGVFWLNYGDCYATSPAGNLGDRNPFDGGKFKDNKPFAIKTITQGNLMLMPHRIALALQADGWIVRQDLVWHKPNPMPESVAGWRWERSRTKIAPAKIRFGGKTTTHVSDGRPVGSALAAQGDPDRQPTYEYGDDYVLRKGSWRHTRAHEYVFMLVKDMQYWSNQEAVREAAENNRWGGEHYDPPDESKLNDFNQRGLNRERSMQPSSGRNPRSVLNVPTAPYKGAHYATFPPNLIAPLIRASCPRWACPVCGQGWAPVVEKGQYEKHETEHYDLENFGDGAHRSKHAEPVSSNVKGYRPTCEHEHTKEEAVPGIVFDPFVGSGTTVMVANELLRRGIGLDISKPYLAEQASVRTGAEVSLDQQIKGLPMFDGFTGEESDG